MTLSLKNETRIYSRCLLHCKYHHSNSLSVLIDLWAINNRPACSFTFIISLCIHYIHEKSMFIVFRPAKIKVEAFVSLLMVTVNLAVPYSFSQNPLSVCLFKINNNLSSCLLVLGKDLFSDRKAE